MKISAIIPARYGSTRFEGKPLADILGKPMIQHVYEGVCQSKLIDQAIWGCIDLTPFPFSDCQHLDGDNRYKDKQAFVNLPNPQIQI
jgi:hypothetical protein